MNDVEQAAEALLMTVCDSLAEFAGNFVVVGGWAPRLWGNDNGLVHPGTLDTDLLFTGDIKIATEAMKKLFDIGCIVSAKHTYQLIKIVSVNGKDIALNIDFMHPDEKQNPDSFRNLFDLNFVESYRSRKTNMAKSIVFGTSDIIFSEKIWNNKKHTASDLTGRAVTLNIPLLSKPGVVISKSDSFKVVGRNRDAFDIYFVLSGTDQPDVISEIRRLRGCDEAIEDKFVRMLDAISQEKKFLFNQNVNRYLADEIDDPAGKICELLQ